MRGEGGAALVAVTLSIVGIINILVYIAPGISMFGDDERAADEEVRVASG